VKAAGVFFDYLQIFLVSFFPQKRSCVLFLPPCFLLGLSPCFARQKFFFLVNGVGSTPFNFHPSYRTFFSRFFLFCSLPPPSSACLCSYWIVRLIRASRSNGIRVAGGSFFFSPPPSVSHPFPWILRASSRDCRPVSFPFEVPSHASFFFFYSTG